MFVTRRRIKQSLDGAQVTMAKSANSSFRSGPTDWRLEPHSRRWSGLELPASAQGGAGDDRGGGDCVHDERLVFAPEWEHREGDDGCDCAGEERMGLGRSLGDGCGDVAAGRCS